MHRADEPVLPGLRDARRRTSREGGRPRREAPRPLRRGVGDSGRWTTSPRNGIRRTSPLGCAVPRCAMPPRAVVEPSARVSRTMASWASSTRPRSAKLLTLVDRAALSFSRIAAPLWAIAAIHPTQRGAYESLLVVALAPPRRRGRASMWSDPRRAKQGVRLEQRDERHVRSRSGRRARRAGREDPASSSDGLAVGAGGRSSLWRCGSSPRAWRTCSPAASRRPRGASA